MAGIRIVPETTAGQLIQNVTVSWVEAVSQLHVKTSAGKIVVKITLSDKEVVDLKAQLPDIYGETKYE